MDAAFGRRSRFAKMHLVIDHARQQPLAIGVDLHTGIFTVDAACDLDDATMADQQIAVELASFIDQSGVANQHAAHGSELVLQGFVTAHQIDIGARHVFGKLRGADTHRRELREVGVGADAGGGGHVERVR